jgi:hypothetical protein
MFWLHKGMNVPVRKYMCEYDQYLCKGFRCVGVIMLHTCQGHHASYARGLGVFPAYMYIHMQA